MKLDTQNNMSGLGRLISQMSVEKNKTMIAFSLVAVMGLLWVRVLTGGKNTKGARAKLGQMQTAMAVQTEPPRPKLVYVELPNVKGRNDVLIRDFFALSEWKAYIENNGGGDPFGKKVSMTGGTAGQGHFDRDAILKVAQSLRLTVIEVGERPHAFINDKLLTIGEKLLVEDEGILYEFKIANIQGNKVLLTCQGVDIEIKLLQPD